MELCSTTASIACSPITFRKICKTYIPLYPFHQQSVENKGLNTSFALTFFILYQVENAPFFSSELPEAMLELLVELGEGLLNCQPVTFQGERGCSSDYITKVIHQKTRKGMPQNQKEMLGRLIRKFNLYE